MVLAALRDRIPRSGWAGLLVRPETVLGWHRALVRRKWAAYLRRPRRGRPRTSNECRQLIVRMAKENPGWGYFRIKGELRKLGHAMAATTIRSVLLRAGIPPSGRRAKLELEAVPGGPSPGPGGGRLPQRRHCLPQAALRP